MRIPPGLIDREDFANDLVQKCNVSLEARKADYGSLRSFYLFGAGPNESPAHFNKINPVIDQLISFLYAADTTRFTIHLGATAEDYSYEQLPVLVEALNDSWSDTGGDKTFLSALTWSLVYNTTFVKLNWRKTVNPYVVAPGSVGVLREDIPYTDRQEAICHSYYMTKSELYDRLYSHPNRDSIIKRIGAVQHEVEQVPAAVDRIVLSQTNPTIYGTVNLDLYGFNRLKAEVSEETVQMKELWVWDSDADDYRCFTIADPGICIYDRLSGPDPENKNRKGLYIKGEQPLIQVCPNPQIDYYWGQSETQKLILLQQMRNKRVTEILDLLGKQTTPPMFLSGMTGLQDERDFALHRAGGLLSNDMPNADVKPMAPEIPEEQFTMIKEIDAMFEEASGINSILSGRGEQGVRSQGHASQLARLGSSRAKKRALIIEDALANVATQYMKLKKAHDATHYKDNKGRAFIMEQFTDDFTVKVDAHSNSPIFMEDTRQLAFNLLKAGAIDKESLLELLDPPMKQLLKRRLKQMPQQGGQPGASNVRPIRGEEHG
jgi:hypothetical protein